MAATESTFMNKFDFPVLTKDHTLNFTALKTIKDEVKANALSIHSDLGGGTFGYLGLVLTAAEYALVSPVPFVRHVNPPPLFIPPGTLQHVANGMRADRKEARQLFKEMTNLEQTLIHQLTQAIPSAYLRSFRNRHSNSIQTTLPVLFASLFRTYGKIPENELQSAEQTLRAKVYDITEPLVVM